MSSAVPKLRFKEFKDDWKIQQLINLLEFKNGVNADKEQYGKGFKFINVLDILGNDFLTYNSIVGSVDIDESTFEKYLVSFGDILFQRSSETREEVGTACVYLDKRPATFGGFVIRGKKIGVYDPIFFNKLLKTDLARNAITSKSGGSTRYNIGQEALSSIKLPFPSLAEQQKIASFLSAVDEKIQQLTRKKELLEQYKKGVMQWLFSSSELGSQGLKDDRIDSDQKNPSIQKSHKSQFRQLRFKDENGKPYPKWEEKTLGDIVSITKGKGISKTDIVEDGELECIRYGELYTHYKERITSIFSRTNLDKRDLVLSEYNDVIIPSSGETQLDIARAACVLKAGVALGGDLNILKTKQNGVYLSYYINHSLKYEIAKVAQGNSVVHLYPSQLEALAVSIPTIEEQQKIASFLTALDAKIESVAAQIAHTQTFKKGLLQQMFV